MSLLAGPDLSTGAESLAAHRHRLGPLPSATPALIDSLERSDLRGRGGAAFPVATKWRTVAGRSRGRAVVLANGSEGEPLSWKDQVLMSVRPHLVLDGAELAAQAVGAQRIVAYVGEDHPAALAAITHAVAERASGATIEVLSGPRGYVTGEESAAVNFVNSGVAAPTAVPPRPFERGVDGRPTLVQNVETLAHTALIARFGDAWFRGQGQEGSAGTLLLSLSGAVRWPGVVEVAAGTPVLDALELAGGLSQPVRAILVGGYFGSWVTLEEAAGLRLDAQLLKAAGAALGCGVVYVLPGSAPPMAEVARIMRYLADESASQCGPCFFGLRALADACQRAASRNAHPRDSERLQRWAAEVAGRGACRHPDGAVGFLRSALRVFAPEFQALR